MFFVPNCWASSTSQLIPCPRCLNNDLKEDMAVGQLSVFSFPYVCRLVSCCLSCNMWSGVDYLELLTSHASVFRPTLVQGSSVTPYLRLPSLRVKPTGLLLPPPKEVMFLLRSHCLSVCLSDNWKSRERILTKFRGGVGHGAGTNEFNFGDDPDNRPDPGVRSPKSAFTGLSKKLLTDFDEILWRAGVWPRDQLVTFWRRSASLSGSGSPFRITIRIREELPRCQHT